MRNGLVIGAGSGVGQHFFQSVGMDVRLSDVVWRAPKQSELDATDDVAVSAYVAEHGPFDLIVYTAGVNNLEWVSDVSIESMVRTFSVNVFGFVTLCGAQEKAFPGHETRAAVVVSDSSHTPMRGSVAYCSSKAALAMAVRCLARELAPNWSVNGVSPGIIEGTPMTDYIDSTVPGFRGWDPEKAKAYEKSMIPMGRRATMQDVTHVLCDTLNAPSYMSGNITELTGGK